MPEAAHVVPRYSREELDAIRREIWEKDGDKIVAAGRRLRERAELRKKAMEIGPPASAGNPSHLWYVELGGDAMRAFLDEALAAAVVMLGEPTIPVRTIHLRLSQRVRTAPPELKQDFQLTELVDPDRGEFCIYLNRRPSDPMMWQLLAHEVAHLLNARLFDCHVEGLNTEFARRFLVDSGREELWTPWEEYFAQRPDRNGEYYAETWRLMRRVVDLAGSESIRRLLRCAVPSGEGSKQEIDIDQWLREHVGDGLRERVVREIRAQAPSVECARQKGGFTGFSFRLPS